MEAPAAREENGPEQLPALSGLPDLDKLRLAFRSDAPATEDLSGLDLDRLEDRTTLREAYRKALEATEHTGGPPDSLDRILAMARWIKENDRQEE